MKLEQKIEAILLFKNEPVSFVKLSELVRAPVNEVREAVKNLQASREDSGIVLITNDDEVALGTHPEATGLIKEIQKEELSRELGRAGLETLAIVLYKAPVSRREIDFIRGVNSGFILRNLLVRGLIERVESEQGERSYSYQPTLEVLRYLGVGKREDLPEFGTAFKKLEQFAKEERIMEDNQ